MYLIYVIYVPYVCAHVCSYTSFMWYVCIYILRVFVLCVQYESTRMQDFDGEIWGKGFILKIFKTEGKKPIVRLRSEWENNIEMDLKEVGWSGIDWFSGSLLKR